MPTSLLIKNNSLSLYMIKVGDIVYCHTAVVMLGSGEIRTTVGNRYTVINAGGGGFNIINDNGTSHSFGNVYETWFTLVDYDETTKLFEVLYN
jgi:hypothetical protein